MKIRSLFGMIIFTPAVIIISLMVIPFKYGELIVEIYKSMYNTFILVNDDEPEDHWNNWASKTFLDWLGK